MNVLQFSGGVDSLACLLMLRKMPNLVVATASTDGAYPERAAYLQRVAKSFPHLQFHHVETHRHLEETGRPVDVVPVKWTRLGAISRLSDDVRYQDTFACCNRSLWVPMHNLSASLGATTIWRGQRNDDTMQAPIDDGTIIDGITYRFPLADWTRDEVLTFVNAHASELVPESYRHGERTSRDCWDCTGYLFDNQVRLNNLPREQRDTMQQVLGQWRSDVLAELGEMTWQ